MVERGEVSVLRVREYLLPLALVVLAGVGWWWTVVTSHNMVPTMGMGLGNSMVVVSLAAFTVAWIAMMAAMMLPAIVPVVRLYGRAAARGTVAPIPFFIAGYGIVWSIVGLPVFFLWRQLNQPLAQVTPTVGRIGGAVLVGAAVYQLSSLKTACLRHCRSPLSFFMRHSHNLDRSSGALILGVRHGLYCLGCCWMLMAVLVVLGTMQLAWMAVIAGLIFIEKISRIGELVAKIAGIGFLALGIWLLITPALIGRLT